MLEFDGPEIPLNSNNSLSASQHSDIIKSKLNEELGLGRIAGPFNAPPFENFKSSPLALREKQKSGKFRLLHNLSYPYDDRSVNNNIPKDASTVSYSSIKDAIHLIQVCAPNAYMAKTDIADAFRLIPLHKSQHHLTGFCWEGEYYYDKCLPQGCSSSCRIFETFSTALKWILTNKNKINNVVKVLDDFLFVATSQKICHDYLEKFLILCSTLGIPIVPHKTVWPVNKITFLGIELNSKVMMASLPEDKLITYSHDLVDTLVKNKVTLRDLKSLIGKLQFSTSVILPGRAFLRRLHDLTIGITKPFYYIRLTHEVKLDLETWHNFLHTFNGKTMIYEPSISDSECLHMYSDASKLGFGGTYGSSWIQGMWPPNWIPYHISILEFYPIYVLIYMFGAKIAGSKVIFHCDNEAVVVIINKQTSKDKIIMSMVRPLVLTLLQHNISLTAQHIPGVDNILSDAISRYQVSPELLRQYGMQLLPTPIPTSLLPHHLTMC